MNISHPIIKHIKTKEFESKQSKYEHCAKLPISSILLGPSSSGKTVLLQNMVLDIFRNCFSRIYTFSPSTDVDMTWEPVKHYIEKSMNIQHTDDEPIYFDHYDPVALEHMIAVQHKLAQYQKRMGSKSYIKY